MIIIAEKINGSIPSMAKAIAERNEDWIKDIAKKEAEVGADFIDCCASVEVGEVETLNWIIDLVQSVTDTPISVDSPNPRVLVECMKRCKKPGLINSVSGEGDKIDVVFPVIADTKWDVMALLCDDTGIPKSAADRIRVLDNIMAKAKEYGIAESRIHIDPLVEMLCTSEDGISTVIDTIRGIRAKDKDVHIICAISNISFNLPARALINQSFATLAVAAGMDAGILDPLNRDLRGAIYAAEACMGLDEFCMEYIGAFREGRIGKVPKA